MSKHASTTIFTGIGSAVFFLFLTLKTLIKGKRFATIEEIKEKSIQDFLPIPKRAFQKCFEYWKKCWYKRITQFLKKFKITVNFLITPHTYIHNWSLSPFNQDYGLAPHTTHFVCVNLFSEHRRRNIFFFIFYFDV